jgi:hypothetical protein
MHLSTFLHARHYKISPYTGNRLAICHNWYVVTNEILYLLYLCCKRGGLQSIILDCYVQIVSCFFCLSSWLSHLWKPRLDILHVRKFSCKLLFLPISIKLRMYWKIAVKTTNTKFHGNPSGRSRAVACGQNDGRTGRHRSSVSKNRFFLTAFRT